MAAVQLEGPGVIRAAEELAHAAFAVGHHLRTLVRATVVQHVHVAVGSAHHQHVLVAQAGGVIVARLGHLAFVAHVDPGAAVDPLHLQIENGGVGVDAAVHAVAAYHRGQLFLRVSSSSLAAVSRPATGSPFGSSRPPCTSTLAGSQ
ncbi:hypothetical protein G6F68_017045 [Rhizopus microsporus]|nr:hypothetical protein G6F68_017045 [Rhizopus microsporus]